MSDARHERPAYQAPKLTRHGSFSELTLASAVGTKLDAAFPAGTPFNDLTFS